MQKKQKWPPVGHLGSDRPNFLCTGVSHGDLSYKYAIYCLSESWTRRMIYGIFLFFAFFRLFDATWRPNAGTNITESLHLDRSRHKLQVCYSCLSELWTWRMIYGISLFVAIFRLFYATWRPNARTNITESLHLDRSRHKLQVCYSLSKWIMNTKDDIWNFLIFCLFMTIWRHLAAKYTNQYSWKVASWSTSCHTTNLQFIV